MDTADRVHSRVDARVAVGLAAFIAWQQGLITSTFSYSSNLLLSPTTLMFFAGCLVLVAVARTAKSQGSFRTKMRTAILVAALSVSTFLAAFADGTGLMAVRYITALIMGVSVAVVLYSWTQRLAEVDSDVRLSNVLAALALAGIAQFAQAASFGAVALILGFVYAAVTGAALASLPSGEHADTVSFRPSGQTHFRMPMAGFLIVAAVFGLVIGTSSQASSPEGSQEFAEHISVSLTIMSIVLLGVKAMIPKPVMLPAVMKFLSPALALLFLAHILFGSIGGWLPCITLGLWQILQMAAVLTMIELAQSGYASVSLVFPVGWSLVCLGQGLGAFVGQATSIMLGSSDSVVQIVALRGF